MEEKYNFVKRIISIASTPFNGVVWGSFVHQVLVPKIINPNLTIDFEGIDISFVNIGYEKIFISTLKKMLESSGYTFSHREKGVCISKDNKSVLIVSTSINPTIEYFDVNKLAFVYKNNRFEMVDVPGTNNFELVDNIINKEVTISGNLTDLDNSQEIIISRLTFLENGWKIKCNHKLNYNNNKNIIETLENNFWSYQLRPKKTKEELVRDILSYADEQNGQIFGQFVRDVIIPDNFNVEFKNIDIWFSNTFDHDAFIICLIETVKEFGWDWKCNYPDINDKRYLYQGGVIAEWNNDIYNEDGAQFTVNTIISTEYPVRDLDVNDLIYRYISGKFVSTQYKLINPNKLINFIKCKDALLYPCHRNCNDDSFFRLLNNNFFEKGWRIKSEFKLENLKKWSKLNNVEIMETVGMYYYYFKYVNINCSNCDIIKVGIKHSSSDIRPVGIKEPGSGVGPVGIKEPDSDVGPVGIKGPSSDIGRFGIKHSNSDIRSVGIKEPITSIKNESQKVINNKNILTKSEKDAIINIFNAGIEILQSKIRPKLGDELKLIYDIGNDEYRDKIKNLVDNQ